MSSQPNQSLADGLLCLQALAIAAEPVGGRALARQLGLNHVKVHRMLSGLAQAGFALQDEHGRYGPGPALHVLGALSIFGSGLISGALPHLRVLAESTGATVAMGVRWQRHVCYIYHGNKHTAPEMALGRTQLHAASASSIGMVLLAQEPHELITELYHNQDIPDYKDIDALQSDLTTISENDYAQLLHQTSQSQHYSIAVPVDKPAIAGLACTQIPTDTTDSNRQKLVTQMRACADCIANKEALP